MACVGIDFFLGFVLCGWEAGRPPLLFGGLAAPLGFDEVLEVAVHGAEQFSDLIWELRGELGAIKRIFPTGECDFPGAVAEPNFGGSRV
jgi:hypothetical protein